MAEVDPFEHSQVFQLQLQEEPETMATTFDELLDNITEHIRMHIWQGRPEGLVEGILITPKEGGHFIIEILPPASWAHNNPASAKLLFSFENLYCTGFQSGGNWLLFRDHYQILKECGFTEGTNLRSLNIDGNYNRLGSEFDSVNLGIFALLEIYKAIKGYPGSDIKGPLRMSAVSFSESLRFPRFRRHVLVRFRTAASHSEDITEFAENFRDWSVYSGMIRNGTASFVPLPALDIHSFADLQNFISMVL